MRYPAPNYVVQPRAVVAKKSHKKLYIIIGVVASVVIIIAILAIALGVGLGVGLKKKSSNSSKSCGTSAVQPTFASRVINGHEATAHSWPWVVALYYNGAFQCGGVLVSSYRYVLTAAHCVDGADFNPNLLKVYAGIHSRSALSDGQVRSVANYKIHPDYVAAQTYLDNDIAILKLSSSFDINDNVNLCCLPSSSTTTPSLNESAVIIGWGRTIADDTSSASDTLLQAEIFIDGVSQYCDASSKSAMKFCAGYGGRDTCQGDSGGPLMTKINNAWACTGIVSYGDGCGHSGYYARVSNFRSFIDSTISSL